MSKHALILSAALLLIAVPALTEDERRLTLATERVVVFKDGYCLVVRRGTGFTDDNGRLFTEEVPDAAVLGTFFCVPEKGRLVSMSAGVVTSESETEIEAPCTQYLELLKANLGKSCTVELEDKTTVGGVIRAVLTQENPHGLNAAAARALLSSTEPPPPGTSYLTSRLTGSLFALRTADGRDLLLPVSRLRNLVIPDAKLTLGRTVKEIRARKRLTFEFEGGAAERELRILYFRPGIRWIPTYRIGLVGDDAEERNASIGLQAEILNEGEDLEDVPVDLVVGVPNFRFRNLVSPFVLERALQHALQRALPELMGRQSFGSNFGGGVPTGQRGGEWRGGPPPDPRGAAELVLQEEMTAGRSQDLYIYRVPRLTLAKGHRAAVPVFDAQAPYRDVYTWDLHLARRDVETAPGGKDVSPLVLSQNRIWHQVDITNGTDTPWTTGPALLLQGYQPLAQELLTYTPAGAAVRVPVTVSVDLRADFGEEETGRKLEALSWSRQKYARIEKLGELRVTNHRKRSVRLEIVCRLGGRAEEASDGGKIAIGPFEKADWQNYQGQPAVNNHSVVTWTIDLKAGETAGRSVKYHYYARHY